jgi:shikimate kinase
LRRNIILIGYRATGKTTVGKLVAQALHRQFVDLDQVLEEEAGESIPVIVQRYGWDDFRGREKKLVGRYADQEGLVLATGGGVVLDFDNVRYLKKKGLIFWLTASPQEIQTRLIRDQQEIDRRPSLTGSNPVSEVEEVLRQRQPLYQAAADIIISTSQDSVEQVAHQIVKLAIQKEAEVNGR